MLKLKLTYHVNQFKANALYEWKQMQPI